MCITVGPISGGWSLCVSVVVSKSLVYGPKTTKILSVTHYYDNFGTTELVLVVCVFVACSW